MTVNSASHFIQIFNPNICSFYSFYVTMIVDDNKRPVQEESFLGSTTGSGLKLGKSLKTIHDLICSFAKYELPLGRDMED